MDGFAGFLSLEQKEILGVDKLKEIPKRSAILKLLLHNPRFAPLHAARKWNDIQDVLFSLGFDPTPAEFRRKTHVYCGDGYLIASDLAGTPAQCEKSDATESKLGALPKTSPVEYLETN